MSTPDDTQEPRDPQVAEWLAVEPLDRLTRARLVRTAMAGTEDGVPAPDATGVVTMAPTTRRLARVIAIAAALLVVLVVGIVALVPRGDDTAQTAADTSATKESPETARAPAGDSAAEPSAAPDLEQSRNLDQSRDAGSPVLRDGAPLPLPSLGALGDLSTRALLEAAVEPLRNRPAGPDTTPVAACAVEVADRSGTPVAAGTGVVDGHPATVLRFDRPDGVTAFVVVVDGTCALGPSVRLR